MKLQIVILLFIAFLTMQENSISLARRVKKGSHVLTPNKEMAADSDCFSLPKTVEKIARKLTVEATKKVVSHSLRKRKGEEEEEENDDEHDSIMAFSSDYHPPKPHPPKNN
ncbi:hypothetical protein AAHA92_02013 [Salvia divinorum]|uniref:Uncharacterized protein n=1 Tax=Salvia divinorum TaxID=28513 RepID=A0ABD1ICF3_SALDI